MSTYAFRAVDVAGVPSRGEVDAETKGQVTEQLRERGLIVLDVSEKNEAMKMMMGRTWKAKITTGPEPSCSPKTKLLPALE